MLSDIDNLRKMVDLLGDEGFVDSLTTVETTLQEVNETMDRVEQIEGEAETALREANEALLAVDNRLLKFDETMSLLEAKIEAGFSIGFFFFALNTWLAGDVFIAAGLFIMGLLGASSLVVTIVTMPQVRRLRQFGRFASDQIDRQSDEERRRDRSARKPAEEAGERPGVDGPAE